jgi:hypothetical protein
MSNIKLRAMRWAAPVALVGALGLAACGGDDSNETTRTAAPVANVGSDQHLVNLAEDLAGQMARNTGVVGSDQHLVNLAEDLAGQMAGRAGVVGSDQHLVNLAEEIADGQRAERSAATRLTAQAEQFERSAELAKARYLASQRAAAQGYVELQHDRAEAGDSADWPNPVAAGNMAAQRAEAQRYVEQQQERAQTSSGEQPESEVGIGNATRVR